MCDDINEALRFWEKQRNSTVKFINKSENRFTETYSAVQGASDVDDENEDENTAAVLNRELMAKLLHSDRIIICGSTKSHCVNQTTRDILKLWRKNNKHIYILEDCCSSIKGFENVGKAFLMDMLEEGVSVIKKNELVSILPRGLEMYSTKL